MQSLTPLRPVAAAAAAALAGVLAVAPQASAAIGTAALNTPPRVVDDGRNLSVPLDVSADQAAGTEAARQVADSLAGSWLDGLMRYAAADAAQATPTCRATVTATDSNGAAGTASELMGNQGMAAPLTIRDQTRDTRWGAGDVDHFTVRMTCTDVRDNSQLSNVTLDQDAVAA